MSDSSIVTDRLDSWKEIAAYVKRSVRTVIRWETQKGLPVHRIPGGERQNVFAHRREIDAWMENGAAGSVDADDATVTDVAPLDPVFALQVELAKADTPVSTWSPPGGVARIAWKKSMVWLGLAAALLAISASAVFWFTAPRQFVFAGEEQITNDGSLKTRLVTDGSNLYYGEWRDGRIVLVFVSVKGGVVHEIPTPFTQTEPMGISPDGGKILALVSEGKERERAVWVIPLHGGSPSRAGSLLCHSAQWSPDGRQIACAFGNAIYLSTDNGGSPHPLQSFSGIPDEMHWSLDGKRIIFSVQDLSTWNRVIWELAITDRQPFAVSWLIPLNFPAKEYGAISVLDGQDDGFVGLDGEGSNIWAFERPRTPWRADFHLNEFTREPANVGSFALDPKARRLYMLKSTAGSGELEWFDKRSRQFRPFLPGISARDVDFSPDGRLITYLRDSDRTLWVAASDGTSPRQIATDSMINLELPRWSPDGKQIAFMGQRASAPYRIYIVKSAGGTPREASDGTDNQGAPTWSPDGRRLVYGRVMCQEERTCDIREIDLQTGKQSMVPGSERLSTARWSPDGQFIAALRSDRQQVFVLSRQTGKWRKVADGANGDDLAWARDSRTLYASRPGSDRPDVMRISVSNGKIEPAFDLSAFGKLTGRIDTWFALTPDDSILFLRWMSGHEVYAIHYSEK
jgi:Tol biopolymer transport system component